MGRRGFTGGGGGLELMVLVKGKLEMESSAELGWEREMYLYDV